MTVENLPQNPLRRSPVDLEIERKATCERNHLGIQEGNSGFEGNRHCCAVYFHKDVIGKIAEHVARHHPIDTAKTIQVCDACCGCITKSANDGGSPSGPVIESSFVKLVERGGSKVWTGLVYLF